MSSDSIDSILHENDGSISPTVLVSSPSSNTITNPLQIDNINNQETEINNEIPEIKHNGYHDEHASNTESNDSSSADGGKDIKNHIPYPLSGNTHNNSPQDNNDTNTNTNEINNNNNNVHSVQALLKDLLNILESQEVSLFSISSSDVHISVVDHLVTAKKFNRSAKDKLSELMTNIKNIPISDATTQTTNTARKLTDLFIDTTQTIQTQSAPSSPRPSNVAPPSPALLTASVSSSPSSSPVARYLQTFSVRHKRFSFGATGSNTNINETGHKKEKEKEKEKEKDKEKEKEKDRDKLHKQHDETPGNISEMSIAELTPNSPLVLRASTNTLPRKKKEKRGSITQFLTLKPMKANRGEIPMPHSSSTSTLRSESSSLRSDIPPLPNMSTDFGTRSLPLPLPPSNNSPAPSPHTSPRKNKDKVTITPEEMYSLQILETSKMLFEKKRGKLQRGEDGTSSLTASASTEES